VPTGFLLDRFAENQGKTAIVWRTGRYSYGWLLESVARWRDRIAFEKMGKGSVTALEGGFSPTSISLLLALIEAGMIVVPLEPSAQAKKEEYLRLAQTEMMFRVDPADDGATANPGGVQARHPLYDILRERGHPGLVLFSSGSTGKVKGTVHDFAALHEKYRIRRHDLVTLSFLLFDHIGGVDTLFYVLSNASTLVTVESRSAESVCAAVEAFGVEVLPVSPTFLKLLLMSRVYEKYDLSSLKIVTYGTEPMPEHTLKQCAKIFPHVRFVQKYGTTEVGTLRSRSMGSDSLWVKVGGEGYETRVVDGILQIKAVSAMLGYLNAPSPLTEDGWFITGDAVEVDGDYIRILGRASEIINVGGEKIYPAEVEDVIHRCPNVAEVMVYGEDHPITGNIVCAKVRLISEEEHKGFIRRLKLFCAGRMEGFKVPVKVSITDEPLHTDRFKKDRGRRAA
jgi:long-chain acyl-CoA synthetase